MSQPIITRFVKGGPSGAIETALLAGAYLKSALKSADGQRLTLNLENADETEGSVTFTGAAAARIFEQHARVPGDERTAIVYVPHDYVDGDPQAQVVTVGQVDEFGTVYRGFSHGDNAFEAFGAFNGRKALDEILGPTSADGATFTLSVLTSFNIGFIRDISKVVINGVEYNVGPVTEFEGAYQRTITGAAALPVTDANFMLNFIFADGENYYRDGTEVLHKAGLYLWNKDLDPDAYEFVGVNARIIVTDRDPPDPSATNNGALVVAPNGVYQYYSEPIHSVAPVVTWVAYAANDYRGAFRSDDRIGDANAQPANSRYYNTSRRRFRVRVAIPGTGPDFIYRWDYVSNPHNSLYPFHYHSRDNAALHVTAEDQIAYTGVQVEQVESYVAGTAATTAYHSRRLLTIGEDLNVIVHRDPLPSAADANFDNIYGEGAEETDGLHYKRKSELNELFLRADNLVASSFSTVEIVGFTTGSGILFHAGGAILPQRPAWLTGISQEFAIGGASYEIFLQTTGAGPVLPAQATVRLDVNEIGSDVTAVIALAKSDEGNVWSAVTNERLLTAGRRYRIRLRLGADGDIYLTIGYQDHLSQIADEHELDALEGELRSEIKDQRAEIETGLDGKLDTNLQNIPANLSDDFQSNARSRIGAASSTERGNIQTKGNIWATTPALPVDAPAGTAEDATYPFAAGERWAITQHAPTGVAGGDSDVSAPILRGLPLVAPNGVEGLWIELLVAGELVDDKRISWGDYPVKSSDNDIYNAIVQLKAAYNRTIRVTLQIHGVLANEQQAPGHQITVTNADATTADLPADTRIRIREARPSFPALSGVDPGNVLGPRVAHMSSAEFTEVLLTNDTELYAGTFGDQLGNSVWTIEANAPAGFAAIATGSPPMTLARLEIPRTRPAPNVSGFVVRAHARPTYAMLGATMTAVTAVMTLAAAPARAISVGTKLRINLEVVEVIFVTSETQYSVSRGQDGTTANAHTVTSGYSPRVSGEDLELFDEADFEWGPGNIYNSNEPNLRNTALSPLKVDDDAMLHVRYVELADEDLKFMALWGRHGRAPVGARIDVHLKVEEFPESDVKDGRQNGLGDPAADGADDNLVGITNDGLHYVHQSPDVPTVRTWRLSGPASQAQESAEQTDGVTPTGAGHFHFRFYIAAPNEPAIRSDWLWEDSGFSRSPAFDGWNADREIVTQQNTDDHPIWILIGSATRAESGNYTYTPWHIYAEFGVQYSATATPTSTERHPARAAGDDWLWLRDTDGSLVGPIPLTERNYSRQLLFNDYLYASADDQHNTKPFVRDLSVYDAIEIELRPYFDYDTGPAARCSALLFRPADGFLTAVATSEANNRYQVRAWDQAALKLLGGNAPVRDDDFVVSALGEYKIHFRFIFKVAAHTSDDRHIQQITAFDHGATYNRARFLVWGINF